MEFPSFQSKDQSKSYEHLSEIHKKDHKPSRQNKSSGREKINKFMKRCSGINTVLLVAILIIGLIILLKKWDFADFKLNKKVQCKRSQESLKNFAH